ncbi:hypothetical protein M433DRAFT_67619 [Acidomyces richmondensis BFW]|nr:MAG: hypothetical protein FE78DRAFT_80343 [Acidomyces sp. 'richmondensis']KYG45296.1 hypothetical protein M433DRAFT_67619 [Acidomyces richmondensis BFW]
MQPLPAIGVSASSHIPWLYRAPLLYLEPLFALSGSLLSIFNPGDYLSTMSRGGVTSIQSGTEFIYTELAGGWLFFAFTEAVIFRLVDDVRTWRLLCFGMLFSDIAYCHSCAQAVGGWSSWIVLSDWTAADWTVTLTTWPFVIARIAIALGIGLRNHKNKNG